MGRHTSTTLRDVQGMTLTPRLFARIVGGLLLLGAVGALALPITIADGPGAGADTVACGDGFKGVSQDANLRDTGREIADAMYPQFADEGGTSLAEQCASAVSTRRAWGWPVAGLGVIVLAGSFVTFAAPRRAAGESAA